LDHAVSIGANDFQQHLLMPYKSVGINVTPCAEGNDIYNFEMKEESLDDPLFKQPCELNTKISLTKPYFELRCTIIVNNAEFDITR